MSSSDEAKGDLRSHDDEVTEKCVLNLLARMMHADADLMLFSVFCVFGARGLLLRELLRVGSCGRLAASPTTVDDLTGGPTATRQEVAGGLPLAANTVW